MRLLAVAAIFAINLLPALAGCNKSHPTPENPTIILGLLGGAMVMWRYASDRRAN
jgi:hypothetical protein